MSDRDALGQFGASLMAFHHQLDAHRFMSVTPDTAPGYGAYLVEQLQRPDALVIVAEHQLKVVGYMFATLEGEDYMALRGPAGMIQDLMVQSDHRRRGIGRQLLDEAIVALSARGVPRIILSAAARNASAQSLFAGRGFRPTMIEMTLDTPAQAPTPDSI